MPLRGRKKKGKNRRGGGFGGLGIKHGGGEAGVCS